MNKYLLTILILIPSFLELSSQNCLPTETVVYLNDIRTNKLSNCNYELITSKDSNIQVTIYNFFNKKLCFNEDEFEFNQEKWPFKLRIEKEQLLNSFLSKDFTNINLIDSIYITMIDMGCGTDPINDIIFNNNTETNYLHEFGINNLQELKFIDILEIECGLISFEGLNKNIKLIFKPILKPWGTIYNKDIFGSQLDSLTQSDVLLTLIETGETTNSDSEGNFYFCKSDPNTNYTLKADYNGYSVQHEIGPNIERCMTKKCKISIHERLQEQIYQELYNFDDKQVIFELCQVPVLPIEGYMKIQIENELENNRFLYSNVDHLIKSTAKLYGGIQPYRPFLKGYIELNDVKSKTITDMMSWAFGTIKLLKATDKIVDTYNKTNPLFKIEFKYSKLIDKVFNQIEKFINSSNLEISSIDFILTSLRTYIDSDLSNSNPLFDGLIHRLSKNSVQGIYINNESNPLLEPMFSKIKASNSFKSPDAIIGEINEHVTETNNKIYDSYNYAKNNILFSNISGKVEDLADASSDFFKEKPGTQKFAVIAEIISKIASLAELGFLIDGFLEANNCQDEIIRAIKSSDNKVSSKPNPIVGVLKSVDTENLFKEYSILLDSILVSLRNQKFDSSNRYHDSLLIVEENLDNNLDSLINNYLGLIGIRNLNRETLKGLENLFFKSENLRMQVELVYFTLPFSTIGSDVIDKFEIICNNVKLSNTAVISEIATFNPVNNNLGHVAFLNIDNLEDEDNKNNSKVSIKIKNFGAKALENLLVQIEGNTNIEITQDTFLIAEIAPNQEIDFSFKYKKLLTDSSEFIFLKIINAGILEDVEILQLGSKLNNVSTNTINLELNESIKLYPNPTNINQIILSLEEQGIIDYLEIYNSFGAIMDKISIQKGTQNLNISLNGYPTGVYFVKGRIKDKYFFNSSFIKL